MRSHDRKKKTGFVLDEDTHLLARSMDDLSAFLTPPVSMEQTAPDASRHTRIGSVETFISSIFGSFNKPKHARQRKTVRMQILFPKENRTEVNFIWAICYVLVIIYSILINVGPIMLTWIIPKDEWCGLVETSSSQGGIANDDDGRRLLSGDYYVKEASALHPYDNPDYIMDPCRYLRVPELFFFTLEECDMSRRLLCSVILGGIIGYERRSADRPAGIRTMGLVSLGACSFTISSIMAFKSSTMGWDASRVTAALPSGVGFLGGALIWKGSISINEEEVHQVHGLTTAASLWLSAAVGVGVGGALYMVTTYVVIMVLIILRYAPKSYSSNNTEEEEPEEAREEENSDEEQEEKREPFQVRSPKIDCTVNSTEIGENDGLADRMKRSKSSRSIRARSVRNLVPTFAE